MGCVACRMAPCARPSWWNEAHTLLKHLRRHGCFLNREGSAHSHWTNPQTGQTEAVPRHAEVPDVLARKICQGLSVAEPGKQG